jgi:peptidoglycan-associated lipoprotein
MMKKWMSVLIVLAFLGVSMTMMSCAKKQVGVAEPVKVEPKPAPVPPPPPPPAPPKPAVEDVDKAQKLRAEIQAFESTHIYFDFDKSDIKAEAKAVLENKASWLRGNPEYTVRIEGHADERGTAEYNLALGDRRAKSAMQYLNALGISTERMSTISYGEERPVCVEKNEACWSRNRRAEFRLSK